MNKFHGKLLLMGYCFVEDFPLPIQCDDDTSQEVKFSELSENMLDGDQAITYEWDLGLSTDCITVWKSDGKIHYAFGNYANQSGQGSSTIDIVEWSEVIDRLAKHLRIDRREKHLKINNLKQIKINAKAEDIDKFNALKESSGRTSQEVFSELLK